jgi:hypothetical protein
MAGQGGLLLVGAGAVLLFALSRSADASAKKQTPKPKPKEDSTPNDGKPQALPALGRDPDARDDQTALARMLESETPSLRERVVVGWITVQRARKLGIPIFEMITRPVPRYGPQILDGKIRYAATGSAPSAEARAVARDLLADRLRPSRQIRERGISPWVELLFPKNKDQGELNRRAEHLVALQKPIGKSEGNFGGIWARVADSEWFLYSKDAPIITDDGRPGSALVALYQVPTVPALDIEQERVS